MEQQTQAARVAPGWWFVLSFATITFAVIYATLTPPVGGIVELHDSFLWTTVPRIIGGVLGVLLMPVLVVLGATGYRRLRRRPGSRTWGELFALVWAVWLVLQIGMLLVRVTYTPDVSGHGPDTGIQVMDVLVPFPGTPEHTSVSHGGATIDSYRYVPRQGSTTFAVQVYQNMPQVSNPPASVLRGFTRGHHVAQQRAATINGIRGILVTMDTSARDVQRYYLFAFEHKRAVYIWMEIIPNNELAGHEDQNFAANLREIRLL